MKKIPVSFKVNGKKKSVKTYPMARLLDTLRSDLKLTGSKEGCGEGECGACSIFMDGRLVNSCLIPTAEAEGAQITTIEGATGKIAAIQEGFLKHGGAQCGICTPGMILAVQALLKKNPKPKEDEIREGLAGNLCRCTGYTKIIESVIGAIRS